eukprot:scaffold25044_cov69-Phaeocystis_antarctica.AAC.1
MNCSTRAKTLASTFPWSHTSKRRRGEGESEDGSGNGDDARGSSRPDGGRRRKCGGRRVTRRETAERQ